MRAASNPAVAGSGQTVGDAGGAFRPVKLVDIHLEQAIPNLSGLERYGEAQVLVRLHGVPLESVRVPVVNGGCSALSLRRAVVESAGRWVINHVVEDELAAGVVDTPNIPRTKTAKHHVRQPLPSVTVAVCTRNRTEDLAECLEGLTSLDYPDLELLVVDNAPSSDATERLVASIDDIRYVKEPRPGLDWARNRAIAEASGEILAFTDDDVVVDPLWARQLGETFAESDEIMAVTGLVVPLELETLPQLLFERAGGFGRGLRRSWNKIEEGETWHLGSGRFGTGANMAFRRSIFELIGVFDPALGAGTATNGGDDLEMFFRVLQEGHVLVYEPWAIVRHRHRRDYDALRKQLTDHGLALYAYMIRSALAYPELRGAMARFGLWWFWRRNLRRLIVSFVRPSRFPRDLIVAEMRGALVGLTRYARARRDASRLARAGKA